MIVVLDSNAAIEIVLKREKENIFRELILNSEKTITSELFRIEIANVIRKYCQGKFIKESDCGKIFSLAQGLIDEFVPISENCLEAFNESIRLHFSAYDMLYLTLARRTGAVLATLDNALITIAKRERIKTVL